MFVFTKSLRIGFGATSLIILSSATAYALNFGIAAGAFAQSFSGSINQTEGKIAIENSIHQYNVAHRKLLREEYGTPDLDRMRMLERNSANIFADILRIENKINKPK